MPEQQSEVIDISIIHATQGDNKPVVEAEERGIRLEVYPMLVAETQVRNRSLWAFILTP